MAIENNVILFVTQIQYFSKQTALYFVQLKVNCEVRYNLIYAVSEISMA